MKDETPRLRGQEENLSCLLGLISLIGLVAPRRSLSQVAGRSKGQILAPLLMSYSFCYLLFYQNHIDFASLIARIYRKFAYFLHLIQGSGSYCM
jgi:hypothetical protein